jgi:hypothetical protein
VFVNFVFNSKFLAYFSATKQSRVPLWASFEQQTDEKKLVKIIKLENNSLECGKP